MEIDEGRNDVDQVKEARRQKRVEARARAEQARRASRAAAALRKKHPLRKHCARIVDVVFKSVISPSLKETVVSFTLQYLLFIRGQTPSLLSELRKAPSLGAEAGSKRPRGNAIRDQRRIQRLLDTIECFDAKLEILMRQCTVLSAVFIFGQSLASAREAYWVRFHNNVADTQEQTNNEEMEWSLTDHQVGLVQKKVARQFVQTAKLTKDCPPKTRVFVLLQCQGLDVQISDFNLPPELALRPDFSLGDLQIRGNALALHIVDCRNPRESDSMSVEHNLNIEEAGKVLPEKEAEKNLWVAFLPRIAL